MFEVIDGMAPQRPEPAKATKPAAREPNDWSNIVFAPGYCQQANADHEERLAG